MLLNSQLFEAIKKSRENVIIENNKMDVVLANMADGTATIAGYVETMESGEGVSMQQKQQLAGIRLIAGAMSAAITNLLGICRGGNVLQAETASVFDMNDLVRSVLQELEPEARSKGVSLRGLEPEATLRVKADSDLIRNVLKSLLNNAIRVSSGSDTVRVVAHPSGASSGVEKAYEISVEDGKGAHRETIHLHAA